MAFSRGGWNRPLMFWNASTCHGLMSFITWTESLCDWHTLVSLIRLFDVLVYFLLPEQLQVGSVWVCHMFFLFVYFCVFMEKIRNFIKPRFGNCFVPVRLCFCFWQCVRNTHIAAVIDPCVILLCCWCLINIFLQHLMRFCCCWRCIDAGNITPLKVYHL